MDSGFEQVADYCREIETYLCRKNDGHLIRVVGPSFEIVSRWAADGVPLKVAFQGIDRYFERYYRSGPRRRPVKIDFCEHDVLDMFDEWRRALGLPRAGSTAARTGDAVQPAPDESAASPVPAKSGESLPRHLERVLARLTQSRVAGHLPAAADEVLDKVSAELDAARVHARGLRGDARATLLARLALLDADALAIARASLGPDDERALARQADDELAGYKSRMTADAYARAHRAAIDRLVRERFGLPTISFE